MPLPTTPAGSGFAIDEAEHTLRFERQLACAPDQAFDAWTKPEQLSLWWDPDGAPLATCEIDLRVGGEFTFTNRSHPEMPFVGAYREISPPNRLVFEAMGSTGRVAFEPSAAGTFMTVEIICSSDTQLARFVEMGVAAGTARTLDNLVSYLSRAVAV